VVNAGHRGKALVERILAFSRTAAVARRPFAVEPVVAETCDLLRGALPSSILFDVRLAAGDACVIGDATQMHQIVMNLSTNALAAMHAGGRLAIAAGTLDIGVRRNLSNGTLEPGEYVVLTVEDTGTGISPETLERIFDPFFTTKPPGSGTGLGLSLVHGIVKDMGGAIDVRTDIGKGTRFDLYFPMAQGANLPLLEDSGDTPHGQGETVMVVDDEPTLVALGEEMLADLGYEPVGFASAQAALASFRADPGRFDIVITDETMPGMSGSEFARALSECRDDVTVLLVSGYSTPAMVDAAFRAGVHDVLTKPLRKRDLGRAVAGALRSRRVAQ
jgi:CheY-like chemotaxis protein